MADEPTTALDVTVQAQVLDLIVRGSSRTRGTALLFITHDLAVVAETCERVLIMYAGQIVESGPVQEVFTRPRHRYTQGLVAASDLTLAGDDGRLADDPGLRAGCRPVPGRLRVPQPVHARHRRLHGATVLDHDVR